MYKKFLLTGEPKAGKSYLLNQLIESFKKNKSIKVRGFISDEISFDGVRIGISMRDITTHKTELMAVKIFKKEKYNSKKSHKIASYQVNTKALENVTLPVFRDKSPCNILIVDEIGRMELLSKKFEKEITKLFSKNHPYTIIAVVPYATDVKYVEKLKNRDDVEMIVLRKKDRGKMFAKVRKKILNSLK